MLFSYPPGSRRVRARERLFHSQIAKASSLVHVHTLLKITFWAPCKNLLQAEGETENCFLYFSLFFSSFKKKNTLEVYVTHSQVAVNLMPRVPNFSRDQHDICVDIKHVFFCVLSFSKCQQLFKIIDNPGLLQHLHMYC